VSLPNFLFRGRTESCEDDDWAGALAVANFYGFLLPGPPDGAVFAGWGGRATHSHHRASLEVARLPGYCDSTGISAKLVRSTENTANWMLRNRIFDIFFAKGTVQT
jgi:hypothetical protein